MSDLISRQAAIDCVTVGAKPTTIKGRIAELPSAEPERKKGKWVDYPIVDGCLQCSVCGILRFDEANYCPNCGADMRGKEDVKR